MKMFEGDELWGFRKKGGTLMIRHEIKTWDTQRSVKSEKLSRIHSFSSGKIIQEEQLKQLLETAIRPGEIVVLEGDNQKQAVQLSKALAEVDPAIVHDLHMVISCPQMEEHLDIFEKGIASVLDFSFAGNSSKRIPEMLEAGTLKIGAIHTYLELYARLFTDLIPNVCLCAALQADKDGNLYTGPNTEETPTLVEATAFKSGIVIAQVDEVVDKLPRIDIPGDEVDVIVPVKEPLSIEPLMTRDPAKIKDVHVLQAMMVIKGIYARHMVQRMNHGIGYNTVAIELLLPTYAEELGLKGKICRNWVSNPTPAMIPAIETGWVKSVVAFGSETGMAEYVAARPDVFFTGADGSLRSNRLLAQTAGLYGMDMFTGATLQMDACGNSSTVTNTRITGFGGAPNMGSNPNGRRHVTDAWHSLIIDPKNPVAHGRKLVTQMVRTTTKVGPTFVNELDAVAMGRKAGLAEAPVMIYGEDLTHLVTEVGIGYVYMAENLEERKKIIAAVAGDTPVGHSITDAERRRLHDEGKIVYPKDLDIDPQNATRDWLAAKNMEEIREWSGGLYEIPDKFKQ